MDSVKKIRYRHDTCCDDPRYLFVHVDLDAAYDESQGTIMTPVTPRCIVSGAELNIVGESLSARDSEESESGSLVILAGDYTEAAAYAAEHELGFSEWGFVQNADSLHGRRDVRIAYVGSWRDRNDLGPIEETLEVIRIARVMETQ